MSTTHLEKASPSQGLRANSLGKRADLTALALDPLVAPADELVDAGLALTVVAGTVSYRGEAWN